jgi:hypothetical protein
MQGNYQKLRIIHIQEIGWQKVYGHPNLGVWLDDPFFCHILSGNGTPDKCIEYDEADDDGHEAAAYLGNFLHIECSHKTLQLSKIAAVKASDRGAAKETTKSTPLKEAPL